MSIDKEIAPIVVATLSTGTPILNPNRFSRAFLSRQQVIGCYSTQGVGPPSDYSRPASRRFGGPSVLYPFPLRYTVGFADFWLTSWIPAGGARTSPLTVTARLEWSL